MNIDKRLLTARRVLRTLGRKDLIAHISGSFAPDTAKSLSAPAYCGVNNLDIGQSHVRRKNGAASLYSAFTGKASVQHAAKLEG